MGPGKAGPNAATGMDSQPLYRTLVSPTRHRTAAYRDHGRMVSRTGVPMDLFARQRTRSAVVRITRFRAVQRNETETVMRKNAQGEDYALTPYTSSARTLLICRLQ